MQIHRLTILRHFTISELMQLLLGKLFNRFRSKNFTTLQLKENKLVVVKRADSSALIHGNEIIITHRLKESNFKIHLRLAGSDVWVYDQVLVHAGYHYVLQQYKQFFGKHPQTIVDAGTNIGLFILYFKGQNPSADIIGIEPDKGNFLRAKQNIEANDFASVVLHHAALWPTKEKLELVNDFRDRSEWSFRVEENNEGTITAVTPAEMVLRFGGEVDLFKIDIEGGEVKLFDDTTDLSWLRKVKVIAIEIHDEFSARATILNLLATYNFHVTHCGELTVAINKHFI